MAPATFTPAEPPTEGAPTASDDAAAARVLVLWAGAKRSEWEAGVGEALRDAAETFRATR